MSGLIVLMIALDILHPPAVSTALSFALRSGPESNLVLFGLAVGMTAVLILLERATLWLMARDERTSKAPTADQPEEALLGTGIELSRGRRRPKIAYRHCKKLVV